MPISPKILRGAFIEYGLSLPPLFVVFQFNPVELSRGRSLRFAAPGEQVTCPRTAAQGEGEGEAEASQERAASSQSLREMHQEESDLMKVQERQRVTVGEESIRFELRLDATDDLDQGDGIAQSFGILPRLSTLEQMMHPKDESLLGGLIDIQIGSGPESFSFTRRPNPPLVLFIWGRTRVLPVNINSMSITETEFSTTLHPIRATVQVDLTVIEGSSAPYLYSKAAKEVAAAINLKNIGDIADVVIPG